MEEKLMAKAKMSNFSRLSAGEVERLAILAEECGEVIQVVGKVLRFGFESCPPQGGPNNREALEEELGHALCALRRMCKTGDVDSGHVEAHGVKKRLDSTFLYHQ